MTSTQDTTVITVTYIGRRAAKGNATAYVFVADGDAEGEERWYKKSLGARIVGGRYSIEERANGAVLANTLTFIEKHSDEDKVAEWVATDRADAVRLEQVRLAKRVERDDDEFTALCAPLRALVEKQVGWARRAALIAAITAEVSR
jgi:hypothetical protein